jgi:hypothetical protein
MELWLFVSVLLGLLWILPALIEVQDADLSRYFFLLVASFVAVGSMRWDDVVGQFFGSQKVALNEGTSLLLAYFENILFG